MQHYVIYTKEWDMVDACDTREDAQECVQYMLKHYPNTTAYYRIEMETITHDDDPRGE